MDRAPVRWPAKEQAVTASIEGAGHRVSHFFGGAPGRESGVEDSRTVGKVVPDHQVLMAVAVEVRIRSRIGVPALSARDQLLRYEATAFHGRSIETPASCEEE